MCSARPSQPRSYACRAIVSAALAVISTYASAAGAAPADRPNILFILVDDVGREVLSCYGGQSYATPEIDRLAAGGERFEHAYVMPVCHPTRTTLLTGGYPFQLGRPEWGTFPRDAESRTLPHLLKQAGYATAVAGKWQLSLLKDDLEQPHRLGFDDYCLLGWHEGPWYYSPLVWQNGRRRTDVADRYGPDVMADYAVDYMTQHKVSPFFLWYATTLCHAETNDLAQPAPVGPHGHYDTYAEMVAKMDREVARLVGAVDQLGLLERTLIVFLADNGCPKQNLINFKGGEYVYEKIVTKFNGRDIPGGKATLTDWGTRVPLILNWPGVVQPGQVTQRLVDASDFLPSLAAVAGVSLPADMHINGQATLLAAPGCSAAERRWVFAENKDEAPFLRNQRWKLYDDGRFFDMQQDADEQHPLDAQSLSPDAAAARRELRSGFDSLGLRDSPVGNNREEAAERRK